jgi:hypothetical protein
LLGAVSQPTKWAERESDRSPPSKAKVKNAWSRNSMFPYAFMAWPAITLPYPHINIKLNNFGSFVRSSMEFTILDLKPHPTPAVEG